MMDLERLRASLNISNLIYWILWGPAMPQPFSCHNLNSFTLGNQDCVGCNKCVQNKESKENG